MVTFQNSGCLVEHASELPDLSGAKKLYLDFETTSFDPFEYGNEPWRGHRICGAAVTVDDCRRAWYVPVRHQSPGAVNVDVDQFQRWLHSTVTTAAAWINHNVKFDAHFATWDGAEFTGKLICTLNRAKLIDSDRAFKGGYGLDVLSEEELDETITDLDNSVQQYLASLPTRNRKKSKDYGLVPPDIMGHYACQDVITGRKLFLKQEEDFARICATETPKFANIWGVEEKLTPVLYDMERIGLRVDPQMLAMKELLILTEINQKQEKIKQLTEMEMEPWNSADCYELICNRWGLPVLAWTNDKDPSKPANPSFDSEALNAYLSHPLVASNPKYSRVIQLMQRVRDQHTLWIFFVKPFRARCLLAPNGTWRIYPTYNQNVRTGRMSAKEKVQQMSKEAKELILPDPGKAFLSCDASQIEFRKIGHYIQSQRVIEAYQKDPDADFHQLIAEWCQVDRDPAKTVNFCTGYGGSKKRVVRILSQQKELMKVMRQEAEAVVADDARRSKAAAFFEEDGEDVSDNLHLTKLVFDHLCQARGIEVYEKYHAMMPELKVTMAEASAACRRRGYVYTEHGRIRRMPFKQAWRAFNSLTQGDAADDQKEVTVEMSPRYNPRLRELGLDLNAQVHDENLYQGDVAMTSDPQVRLLVVTGLESGKVPYSIPTRFGCGWSDKNWAIACGKQGKIPRWTFDPTIARK